MKTLTSRLMALMLALTAIATLASCDDDWWNSYTDSDVDGRWRVVEASYGSPYEQGDAWNFYSDGRFTTAGNGLYEEGYWDRDGRMILIAIGTSEPNLQARVRNYDGDYMVLDVDDYDNGRYTLRLVREDYYGNNSPRKQ